MFGLMGRVPTFVTVKLFNEKGIHGDCGQQMFPIFFVNSFRNRKLLEEFDIF